jgi:hypothetical protein
MAMWNHRWFDAHGDIPSTDAGPKRDATRIRNTPVDVILCCNVIAASPALDARNSRSQEKHGVALDTKTQKACSWNIKIVVRCDG